MNTLPPWRPELQQDQIEWFKRLSLKALAYSLSTRHYPGYPTERYFSDTNGQFDVAGLPSGPWEYNGSPLPAGSEREKLKGQALTVDNHGRPLHPWLIDMLGDQSIGVVTGKGFYWEWGPNLTADPIIIRRDLSEPHVLLIERGNGTGLALPGGFRNPHEPAVDAAAREGCEETGVDVLCLPHSVRQIYQGPLADLRVTAHAWPETTAFCFELDLSSKEALKHLTDMMSANRVQRLVRSLGRFAFTESLNRIPWKGGDDAKKAKWVPISDIDNQLFGSHRLLIRLAVE